MESLTNVFIHVLPYSTFLESSILMNTAYKITLSESYNVVRATDTMPAAGVYELASDVVPVPKATK